MSSSVQVRCLCGENSDIVPLKSAPPIQNSWCSCSSCRYTTGVLTLSCLPLSRPPSFLDALSRYDSSEHLTRYFCGDCGSHMCVHVKKHDAWGICSGVIDRFEQAEQVSRISLENIVQHEFVGDTIDGGLAVSLAESHSHAPIPLYLQGPDGPRIHSNHTLPKDTQDPSQSEVRLDHLMEQEGPDGQKKEQGAELRAQCHCGGVSFSITRPNPTSSLCSSPWPDLLVPYHSASSENPEDVKWWLRNDGSKFLAGTCACRSCRLAAGSPVQTWAFIPKANIFQLSGQPLTYDFGTLKRVESSPNCFREFCHVCGASVFWHCRQRPDVVDVSVGILRAPEGSRAGYWLDWCTDRVSFREHALDMQLIDQLEKGLKRIKPGQL
ncbi:hypothetical protein PV10_06867 [Exophiala mesophila]|uniref:CENP-V/GFA domain-containing protein n=1 Tax=Exophiala mesophila TaxID=212818 RepID=A0A0D1WKK4_EXOME|nr:uncharacterized protein PV10_06867 [Exophiala mesophila]KIV89470.1 hypothetical protein PV10_06867 [Exophiala mesophila]